MFQGIVRSEGTDIVSFQNIPQAWINKVVSPGRSGEENCHFLVPGSSLDPPRWSLMLSCMGSLLHLCSRRAPFKECPCPPFQARSSPCPSRQSFLGCVMLWVPTEGHMTIALLGAPHSEYPRFWWKKPPLVDKDLAEHGVGLQPRGTRS